MGKIRHTDATTIGCENGHKSLHIATMNVDTLRTQDSIDSVINNLQENDIDIACIQETHNNRNDHIEKEEYAIYFIGEITSANSKTIQNKTIKAGVAIAIKTKLKNNIAKIKRYSSRSIEIQLKTTKYTKY